MEKINQFYKNKIKEHLSHKLNSQILLKIYRKIDSTNNQAKKYIESNGQNDKRVKDWVVFAADSQFEGRGRRGHSWLSSDPASVSVSFLLPLTGDLDQSPQITAAASLAVKETFSYFDLRTKLKWPNDILLNKKKICGILSELVLKNKSEAYIIIGCGVNLNNEDFSPEIKEIASSYYLESGKKIDKNLFLAELISKMNFYLKKFLGECREEILNSWKAELRLAGKKVDLTYKNQNHTGIIKEILNSGELLVKFDSGEIKKLQSINTSIDYLSLQKYN